MEISDREDSTVNNEIHSSDEYENEAVFNSSSYRAFSPPLHTCERRIIRCIFSDNLDNFIRSCAETSMFIEKNIMIDDIQYLSSYKALKFPTLLNQANIMHIVVLLSAHRILEYLLGEYPASRIWSVTKEGINAVHIAAAIGDYLALRMLLQKEDAPIIKTDEWKRTPLHYATQTNLETVITLLSCNKKLLKSVDIDGLTPLQFIRHEDRPAMQQFLKLHTELLEQSEENDQGSGADNGKAVNLRHLMEAPLLFDSYVCVYQAQRRDNICENCNTRGSNHENFCENKDFMRVIANRKYGFVRRPTNAFGQFEITFSPVVSQYIRLTESTTIERLETLLFDLWQMPKPGLVLSYYGTDPFSPSLQKLLEKSLGRIASQTRTWLLTDGREKCVGDVVSKAVKAYAEAYGMKQLQVIGLVPWRRLYNSQVLRSSDYMGREQMAFPKKPPGNDTRIQLAENHTHYIFLDSKENFKDLPLCRAQFEAFIVHLCDHTDGANRIPVCGVLIEGDRSNLIGVSYSLRQNIPFIVISDTGGLATALEIFVKFMKQLLQGEVNETFQLKWSNCKYNLRSLTERAKGVMKFEPCDEEYLAEILERAYLLEFVTSSYEGSTEMDARILRSLVKPELFEGIDEEESWNFRIGIALSLNRTDILPENMFSRVQWKDKKGMKELVTKCLMDNNTDFIRLLVDSGLPLHEYVDDNLLAKLYKADFDSNDPRVQIFRNYVLALTPVPQIFRWSQMREIVKDILGFEPGTHLTSTMSRARRATSFEGLLTMTDNQFEGEESLLQLLIWSFLCRRFDLSYLIWTLMKDSIPAALMLACFARKMRSQQQSQREVAELDKMAEFYERTAVGILEECHITDSQSTLTMLCTMRPLYGNLSQLLLAEESQSMNFIEHQACQTCIDNMWNRHLSSNIRPISYFMSLAAGVILPPLVPFIADYNYSESRRSEKQDSGHASSKKASEKNKTPPKSTYKSKLLDFYKAPCVRFAYSAYVSVLFLGLYFYFLLAIRAETDVSDAEIILHISSVLLIIQHIVSSMESNKSMKQYFDNIWNRLVLLTVFLYIIGSLHYIDSRVRGFDILAVLSRLFLACCLLCACAFTLHFFVVSRYIGPKLMMIITIMKRDMLPYMAIICVFWLMFSFFTVAMIFKPTGQLRLEQGRNILVVVRTYFFSMFGEFNVPDNFEAIQAYEDSCPRYGDCTFLGAKYIYPVIMIVYVLLTHVLLLNLLIAMFTKRYSRMEHISKQLWAMQKFGLVKSFAKAPPLPFPYVVVWPFYTAFLLICRICKHKPQADTPFCFAIDETRQRQIVNWQKFRSIDYLHRHSKAYSQMRAQARSGKDGKKDWWIESDVKTESLETQVAAIGAKLPNEFIETRLLGLKMRLAVGNLASAHSSDQAPPKYTLEAPNIYQDYEETKIASLEERGKVVSRSQSRRFNSFRLSKVADPEPEKLSIKQVIYDNHKVVYFNNPQDDITPHSLTRFIPWTEELPNYEPKFLDNAERFTPDWTAEDTEKNITKGRRSAIMLKNPTGRTGTAGRGLLPAFGPNSAVVVVLILEENMSDYEPDSRREEMLRRILLRSVPRRKHQLPWFICKHTTVCDRLECIHGLFLSYMHSVADEASKLDSNQSLIYRLIVEELENCPIRLCHLGELEDWVNCDNAWIDITAICVRITTNFRFWDIIPLLFATTSSKAEWFEVSALPPVKSSHFCCLAYFLEAYLRRQAQTDA